MTTFTVLFENGWPGTLVIKGKQLIHLGSFYDS
jgi:hypothetical protein